MKVTGISKSKGSILQATAYYIHQLFSLKADLVFSAQSKISQSETKSACDGWPLMR
jgi:hypothetical protein